MSTYEKAMKLEARMIPYEQWAEKVPEHVRTMAEVEVKDMVPTGIAYDDERGWCIIQTGQGPYIFWSER